MRKGDGMSALAMLFIVAVRLACPLFAAVDGVVMNATTGKPQASVIVSLVQPGASGMQTIASVKSGRGRKIQYR